MWCNCITVIQLHHVWLRTALCEGSLLTRSRPEELVALGGEISRSSSDPDGLFLAVGPCSSDSSKYLGLDKKSYYFLISQQQCETLSFISISSNLFCVIQGGITEQNISNSFLYNKTRGYENWFHKDNWTHGQCSFLHSSLCECSHTHTSPHHTSHTLPSADRGYNSTGSLWKTRMRSWEMVT